MNQFYISTPTKVESHYVNGQCETMMGKKCNRWLRGLRLTHSTWWGPPEVCSSAGRDEWKHMLICKGLWRSSARTWTRTVRDPPDDRNNVFHLRLTQKSSHFFHVLAFCLSCNRKPDQSICCDPSTNVFIFLLPPCCGQSSYPRLCHVHSIMCS